MGKKWHLRIGAGLLLGVLTASCSPTAPGSESESTEPPVVTEPSGSSEGSVTIPDGATPGIDVSDWDGMVRVYYKYDGDISDKAIYVWGDTTDGVEYEFDGVEEGYGPYKDFDCGSGILAGDVSASFKFIIKNPGTWDGQSQDTVVQLSKLASGGYEINGRRWLFIWAIDGQGNAVEAYPSKAEALGDNFTSALLNPDWKHLDISGTASFDRLKIYAFTPEYMSLSVVEQYQQREDCVVYENNDITDDSTSLSIDISGHFDPQTEYMIEGYFDSNTERLRTTYANCYNIYDTEQFIEGYTYSGHDLGVSYSKEGTTFKVWAPTSCKAQVYIYDYGTPKNLASPDDPNYAELSDYYVYDLANLGQGVYGATLAGDFEGKFYQIGLTYNGAINLSIDPYAKASGVNGIRGAIIDFDKTNPEGWDEMSFSDISSPTELTVYEAHVRDLTIDKSWNTNDPDVKRGTYDAFVQPGTTYNGVTTGFDSIKEMGINAIQLLPVFDQDNDERTYDSVDPETGKTIHHEPDYNWGYNPQNYNIPEGSYSNDPSDPYSRVRELKNLICELSKQGIRTIMDVVYNHVSTVGTHPFQIFVPRYYFRYTEDGYLINDTGVNNTVNSDRVMASRFIVDSVDWWASEYKMMGFRFDLMAVIDTNTMRAVKDSLYEINEDIVVYGEPWTGGSSSASTPSNTYNVYANLADNGKGSVGAFNDCVRDGMKGNTVYANVTPSTGAFLDSTSPSFDSVWNSATMFIGENRHQSSSVQTPPEMSVNYLSCHDNYTLYDQLNYQLHGQINAGKDHIDAIRATVASTAALLFSEGVAFIHGGEEIFRTKLMKRGDPDFDDFVATYGQQSNAQGDSWIAGDGVQIDEDTWLVRNSYTWGDAVNGYKWDRKYRYKEYFDDYVEAIHERQKMIEDGYLGQTAEDISSGSAGCFANGAGSPVIGGYFKSGTGTMVAILGGRCGSQVSINLPAAVPSGTYEIVYSSIGRSQSDLAVNGSVTVGQYETLLLRLE